MDVGTYYITTITNAAMKLGPLILFVVVGYFIFIKLPFLFFLRNMNISKKEFEQKLPEDFQKDYNLEDYKDFQRRMRLINNSKTSDRKADGTDEKKSQKKDEKAQQHKQERQQNQRQNKRAESSSAGREQVIRNQVKEASPEEVFELKAGEKLSQAELRKRYHELLKKNHPDRVASMGPEFKKLAEKNTKDINRAYEKLKNKAA